MMDSCTSSIEQGKDGHKPPVCRKHELLSEEARHAFRERSRLQLLIAYWSSSFFWRALVVAVPNGLVAMLLSLYVLPNDGLVRYSDAAGVGQIWTGYNFVLGFLVVFQTTHSYGRYWEGATLLHQIRGEWFNAVSCLFAFSSPAPEKRREVEHFQNLVVRLASMLHCAALQQVTVMEIKEFQTIEIEGMDPEAIQFLQQKAEKTEVLLQWIQRLVVDASTSGVLPIAPPILSRVFQELSRGIVNLNNARKITDVPFPHPYTVMINLMLAIQWVVTPLVAATVTQSWIFSGTLSLVTVFAFWSTVHIAAEIQNPYGDDPNDLPLVEYQLSFNQSLLTLLDARAQVPPFYAHTRKEGRHLGAREMSSAFVEWLAPVLDQEHWRGKSFAVHRLTRKTLSVSSNASIKSNRSDRMQSPAASGKEREPPLHGAPAADVKASTQWSSSRTPSSLKSNRSDIRTPSTQSPAADVKAYPAADVKAAPHSADASADIALRDIAGVGPDGTEMVGGRAGEGGSCTECRHRVVQFPNLGEGAPAAELEDVALECEQESGASINTTRFRGPAPFAHRPIDYPACSMERALVGEQQIIRPMDYPAAEHSNGSIDADGRVCEV